ncbi:hypothetical protein AB834_01380 [PVC group bacterium (ex Bugula neritina AB1)]|nr:hypothetical protein AB834_01380 [PVC group bacterium (ex Bugula neritina AB1)]
MQKFETIGESFRSFFFVLFKKVLFFEVKSLALRREFLKFLLITLHDLFCNNIIFCVYLYMERFK